MAEGAPKVLIKVVDSTRTRKFGFCVSTLEDLVEKCRNAFQILDEGIVKVVLDGDGTQIIDDLYLQCLEPNTVLMVLIEAEIWAPEQSGMKVNQNIFTPLPVHQCQSSICLPTVSQCVLKIPWNTFI